MNKDVQNALTDWLQVDITLTESAPSPQESHVRLHITGGIPAFVTSENKEYIEILMVSAQ